MRNLPASFWQPPKDWGSKSPSVHSRENSLDNTLSQGNFSPQPAASPQPNMGGGGPPPQAAVFRCGEYGRSRASSPRVGDGQDSGRAAL